MLLREIDLRHTIVDRFAECFVDHRDPGAVEHPLRDLLAQRTMAIALGYEDLNDHDNLRRDEMLALAVGKVDITGDSRVRQRDRGAPLAGKSTLNRLELTQPDADASERYKKIVANETALKTFWIDLYLATHPERPEQIVIDFDATDDRIHGQQEGRFYHPRNGSCERRRAANHCIPMTCPKSSTHLNGVPTFSDKSYEYKRSDSSSTLNSRI